MKSTKKILTENGLDFEIQKRPMFVTVDNKKVATPYFGLYNEKTGEVINTVKNSYGISQNKDIVDMVRKGMKPFGNKLEVSMAGSLHGGRKVYMQLGIEGVGKVGDDILKRYVTIIDSNDGTTGLSVGIGDFTMSCENQFYHFYKSGTKFRHTSSIADKIKQLPQLISEALGKSLEMIQIYNKMASTPLTKKLTAQLIEYVTGNDITDEEMSARARNAVDALEANIAKEVAQKGFNLWGLHSGVTRWTTHDKSAPRRENGRLDSLMTSTNYQTNHKSLEFVLEHI